jgi:serine protease Do
MTGNRLGKVHLLPLVLTTLLGAGAATLPRELHHAQPAPTPPAPVVNSPTDTPVSNISAATLSSAFVNLAKRVTPAVVRIEVRKTNTNASDSQGMDIPQPFLRFFGFPDGQQPQAQPQPQPYEYAGGTGFIITPDGTIVTNNHVVADADEITVWLHDGHSMPGKVVGRDPTTDVAVVKIDGHDLPTLSFGNSDQVQVGELVMAVGNPGIGDSGPLDYSVTTGIVSAKGRPLQLLNRSLAQNPQYGQSMAGYAIEDYLQTDAVINPGNSGGPLVDINGNVVGVNSAIASTSGYYQGYGFAIPSDLVNSVSHQLMTDGEVHRARLGVMVTGVTPEDAQVYKLPSVSGVLVQSVTEDSPANGKLKAGDVIVALNGEAVGRPGKLQSLVAEHQPGDKVTVSYYRDGDKRDVDVKLSEVPFHETKPTANRSSADAGRLGIGLADPGSDAARQMGVDTQGALVVRVDPMGPAARAGLQPGDVITEANGHKVTDVNDLTGVLSSAKKGSVMSLRVMDANNQPRIANVRVN